MEFKLRQASREDAPFIAETVMRAMGDAICSKMAGKPEKLPLIVQLFTELAAAETSQYSYRNTLIAETPDHRPAGAVVSYDGAMLYQLRQAFIDGANRLLGWNVRQEDFTPETSDDEFYLDSLMVSPEYRRRGLAGLLIREAAKKAREAGKPLGLLVDHDNPGARRLYVASGFKSVGTRPFAGVDMEHMQLDGSQIL